MNRIFPHESALQLLRHIREQEVPHTYDPEKHRLTLTSATGFEMFFRLPLTLSYSSGQTTPINYVMLLIQSGSCALGYFENGKNLDHKVYRSYMVRKKQGKSQIKYLKTKGKSRAGSRVRLGETLEFFENINGRLQLYFERHRIDRIAVSCSKTLLPYLYSSKVATPFDKQDPRLYKIPKHIHTPIYEVLLDANRYLQRGELIFEEALEPQALRLLADSEIAGTADREEFEADAYEPDDYPVTEDDADLPDEDPDDEYYLD